MGYSRKRKNVNVLEGERTQRTACLERSLFPAMKLSFVVLAVIAASVLLVTVKAQLDPSWQDTDTTTK